MSNEENLDREIDMAVGKHPQVEIIETPIKLIGVATVKSPSDSTIYTPALRKAKETDNLIEKISDFVESVRLEESSIARRRPPVAARVPARERLGPQPSIAEPVPGTSRDDNDRSPRVMPRKSNELGGAGPSKQGGVFDEARDITNQIMFQAKQNRGILHAPKGMNSLPIVIDERIQLLRKFDDDDDFFHVTCHVDPMLNTKIERGEFVELEKLISRDKSVNGHAMGLESKLELYHRDGQAYFAAAQDSSAKINNIRKWD